jgi:hypothetical protein
MYRQSYLTQQFIEKAIAALVRHASRARSAVPLNGEDSKKIKSPETIF